MLEKGQEKQFVRRLMVAKCDKGNMDYQYLNLPLDHGVYFQNADQPLMNANDHDGDKHILQFGRCTSERNPKNKADELISSVVAFNPLLKIADRFVDKARDALGCEGCKCNPIILNSWENVDEANRLDGAPAITNKSKVYCEYGGIITITEIPQGTYTDEHEDDMQQAQSQIQEKEILDTIPKAMKDKINNVNESLLEDTEQWYKDNSENFVEMYGVSDTIIEQNYMNNRSQIINPACLNEEGFISDTSLLYNFNIGSSNVARIGSSCAASYNLFQALENPLLMCEIVQQAELRQTVSGFMDEGPMAVSLGSMLQGVRSMGFTSNIICGSRILEEAINIKKGEACVLGISAGKSIEFCTFKSDEKGIVSCAEKPKLSVKELCSLEKGKQKALLKVGARPVSAIVQHTGQHIRNTEDKEVKGRSNEQRKIYSI